ncbi:apoptosis-stimulating of p53 protein 2-like isoform X2 [Conger conger]|uniref:apoptosis-stimulating of p53 protein 2-like isoform X2 n=1 Tax=Conger conger TaxID=82655 RepID=UPI002A5A7F36|nr:apoptosis-stimulating of p53 protein 2-like isoform X2 [Conger conger]
MRYEAKMMPMFLTVYLSNNDQHFTEVPVTPETLCRDVLELCKEPGEVECYLAEVWRGSERVVGEAERMLDVLQRGGQQAGEVRFFLRHERPPSRESAGSRGPDHMAKRNGVKGSAENGVAPPRMDMTLAELQEMASRQQQQIDAQQQLLASKEQRLRFLKQQDQRSSEQERLQRLRENAEGQEAKLRKVRALRGQVEHKRLSNGKLVEEIEQMSSLFQQKQRELVLAVSKVEDLSRQLEMLKNGKMDTFHDKQSSAAELDRLYKELQVRNKLNQEQSARLQQQRDSLNKRNLEVAAMDRRVSELRDRLWKKKAALQQKENLPVPSDGHAPQQGGASRVAAVGPYLQSSSLPRGGARHELLVKPPPPDATATLPHEGAFKARGAGHAGKPLSGAGLQTAKVSKFSDWSNSSAESGISHGSSSTLPRMSSQSHAAPDDPKKLRPLSMLDASEPSTNSLRKNPSSEDLLRDPQGSGKAPVKVPPPVPSKPKPLPPGGLAGQHGFGKPGLNTGTFPGKARPANQHAAPHRGPAPGPAPHHSHTLPLPPKQEAPPAAKVRPFTPELPAPRDPAPPGLLHKPQTLAASSIYSMYTQQPTAAKSLPPALQGTLTRSQPRLYGKPVIPGGPPQPPHPDHPYADRAEVEVDHGGAQEAERVPRPLSPTKLLPFLSGPFRHQGDGELEALRRKLYHAPRPLKKRSSITEPEGPAGPNIQKLLYQKTTLAAMETVTVTAPFYQPEGGASTEPAPEPGPAPCPGPGPDSPAGPPDPPPASFEADDDITALAPPLAPRPAPIPEDPPTVAPPPAEREEEEGRWEEPQEEEAESGIPGPAQEGFVEEYPPYPPPPYPTGAEGLGDSLSMQPPEVTGHVPLPPGKRTNLRKLGSERIAHAMRVRFNPLALLLDSSLEGEYDLVQRIIYEVEDPSLPNDEGITALHNAVCAGHTEIVKFLVQFGVNVNAADSDGWTPLHCAASCNNVQVCKFLVESGAAVFATTYSDMQTAADKCEEMEEGYAQCSQFLYGVQEKMGIMNRGVVYALWDYAQESQDELVFSEGDCMTVVRREDEEEVEWWWARRGEDEGYIPRNLLGLYPRIKQRQRSLA